MSPRRSRHRSPPPFPKLRTIYCHSHDGVDENLLILLHGLGDRIENFIQFAVKMQLPQTALLAIQAPYKIPFYENDADIGTAWWPSIDPRTGDFLDHDCKEAKEGRLKTRELVGEVLRSVSSTDMSSAVGWVPGNIFILGFSQGGSCGLDVVCNGNCRVGGVISISGWLESVDRKQMSSGVKVLITHGTKDEKVSVLQASEKLENLKQVMPNWKEDLQIALVDGKGHDMPKTQAEMRAIMQFFGSNLSLRNLKLEAMSDVVELSPRSFNMSPATNNNNNSNNNAPTASENGVKKARRRKQGAGAKEKRKDQRNTKFAEEREIKKKHQQQQQQTTKQVVDKPSSVTSVAAKTKPVVEKQANETKKKADQRLKRKLEEADDVKAQPEKVEPAVESTKVEKKEADAVPVLKKVKLTNAKMDKLKMALMKSKSTAVAIKSGADLKPNKQPEPKANPKEATPAKSTAKTPAATKPTAKQSKQPADNHNSKTLSKMQEKMKKSLAGGRFRMINEKLYTTSSEKAVELFTSEPETFEIYHEGFRAQVESWPLNPVDYYIGNLQKIKPANPPLVIADLGCGEGALAQSLMALNPPKGEPQLYLVHSFDLASPNEYVVACDIKNLPLKNEEVNVAVFSLSLMGTNFLDFLTEAWRILKKGGQLKIAEVISRFPDEKKFIKALESIGFKFISQDKSNKMFILFEFRKIDKPAKKLLQEITKDGQPLLTPCIYKKR
ncbi:25S rRNA (adenine645-N1)-methyltransferase [Chytridiales sp. JEL 0842]|nr:25S rRNA (adenine645-N1)-methyltransferase [Chytridiales sp. JEL 0842]